MKDWTFFGLEWSEFRFLFFGLLLIVVIIFLPRGIVGGAKQFWEWVKKRYYKYRKRGEVYG